MDLNEREDRTWRQRLEHMLKGKRIHFWLVFLLICDVAIVITSIALEIEFLSSEVRDLEHLCETGSCPLSNGTEVGLHPLEEWKEMLAYVSVGILSFFLVEFALHFIALGPKRFFHKPLLVFDVFVVVASMVIELTLENSPEGGLIILARSWRFVRIGHGLYESVHEHDKAQLKNLKILKKMLQPVSSQIDSNNTNVLENQHLFTEILNAIDQSHILKHKSLH